VIFSKKESEARKRYNRFVEDGTTEEKQSPMTKVYAGMMLGGEDFIRATLKRIEENQLQNESISHRKALRAPIGAEDVLSGVCSHYGISRQDITKSENNEARKVFIYLTKKQTVATTREIGHMLGEMSYAAVAKMCQRTVRELAKNKELREKIEGARKSMSCVDGLLPEQLFEISSDVSRGKNP
jgi:hypothetical protein